MRAVDGEQHEGWGAILAPRTRGLPIPLPRAVDPARLVLSQIKAHSPCATAPEEAQIPTRLARAWPRHFPT